MLCQSTPHRSLLGILGGMGSWATLDFARQLAVYATGQPDQYHVPYILFNDSSIPDRSVAFFDNVAASLPGLIDGLQRLEGAGCDKHRHRLQHRPPLVWRFYRCCLSSCNPYRGRGYCMPLRRTIRRKSTFVVYSRATREAGFYQRKLIDAGFLVGRRAQSPNIALC